MSSFTESEERQTLRKEVAKLASSYGNSTSRAASFSSRAMSPA